MVETGNSAASIVAAERTFSSAGWLNAPRRTRLGPRTLQASVLLSSWWHDELLGFNSITEFSLPDFEHSSSEEGEPPAGPSQTPQPDVEQEEEYGERELHEYMSTL